ncbi:MAG: exodeoxyribonuclease VII small subunit [Cyclobacteriaceae bacterium]|nr:exodeoxyribonuclease VII small subunit [Cyclobacteriaceae bacterium]MCH8515383.1 exodeoxyribonuclease VII small subunit [Cyclobacteriaceae bacterium]
MAKRKYTENLHELQEILSKLEQGEIAIDELSSEVKKALSLVRECKKELRKTEKTLDELLDEQNLDSELE